MTRGTAERRMPRRGRQWNEPYLRISESKVEGCVVLGLGTEGSQNNMAYTHIDRDDAEWLVMHLSDHFDIVRQTY